MPLPFNKNIHLFVINIALLSSIDYVTAYEVVLLPVCLFLSARQCEEMFFPPSIPSPLFSILYYYIKVYIETSEIQVNSQLTQ